MRQRCKTCVTLNSQIKQSTDVSFNTSESLISEVLSARPPPLHDEDISKYALSSFSLRNDRGVAVVWTHKVLPDADINNRGNRQKNLNNVGKCEVTATVMLLTYGIQQTTEKVLFFYSLNGTAFVCSIIIFAGTELICFSRGELRRLW